MTSTAAESIDPTAGGSKRRRKIRPTRQAEAGTSHHHQHGCAGGPSPVGQRRPRRSRTRHRWLALPDACPPGRSNRVAQALASRSLGGDVRVAFGIHPRAPFAESCSGDWLVAHRPASLETSTWPHFAEPGYPITFHSTTGEEGATGSRDACGRPRHLAIAMRRAAGHFLLDSR